jgi:hypothetical protein
MRKFWVAPAFVVLRMPEDIDGITAPIQGR